MTFLESHHQLQNSRQQYNLLQPIIEDTSDSIAALYMNAPSSTTSSTNKDKIVHSTISNSKHAGNLSNQTSSTSAQKRKKGINGSQGPVPVAHLNMADSKLLKFCTGCGWKYKILTDRFCGECGAPRREK